MRRPKSVLIAGREIKLCWKKQEAMPDAHGEFVYSKARINVARGQLPYDEADTVLHEIFHGILHAQGREEDPDTEERFVRALATGLLPVLRDNPELVAWLMREMKV